MKWCALLPKNDARCPELARACSRGATAELVGQRARRQDVSLSVPAAPLPIRAILWIMLALVVAFVVYAIGKQALAQRAPDKDEAVEIATAAPEDPAAAIARQIETDVQRLLERARVAAAAGDFLAAVGDAYAALLRKLEGAGVITVESHRTNGDHVRDVGRQAPALRPRMQAVVHNVEEVQFGGGAATESRFRSVLIDVMGLLGEKLAAWLPFAVKLAVGLGLARARRGLHSIATASAGNGRPRAATWCVDLLQRYGFTPRERLAPLSKLDRSVSALLLLPGASVDEDGWQSIATWVGGGRNAVRRRRQPHPAELDRRDGRRRRGRGGDLDVAVAAHGAVRAGPPPAQGQRDRSRRSARADHAYGLERATGQRGGRRGRRPARPAAGSRQVAVRRRAHATRAAAARSCWRTIAC